MDFSVKNQKKISKDFSVKKIEKNFFCFFLQKKQRKKQCKNIREKTAVDPLRKKSANGSPSANGSLYLTNPGQTKT